MLSCGALLGGRAVHHGQSCSPGNEATEETCLKRGMFWVFHVPALVVAPWGRVLSLFLMQCVSVQIKVSLQLL